MTREERDKERWLNAENAIPPCTAGYLSANQIYNRQGVPRLPRRMLYPMLERMAQYGQIDMVRVGPMSYYRRHSRGGGIDPDSAATYNDRQRNKFSLDADVDYLYQTMSPLRKGKPVNLWMELPKKSVKKTTQLLVKRLVVIVPGSVIGLPRDAVLIAIVGAGSCLLRPLRSESIANLVLAGMPAKLASELSSVIRRIFKE